MDVTGTSTKGIRRRWLEIASRVYERVHRNQGRDACYYLPPEAPAHTSEICLGDTPAAPFR